MTRLGWLEGNRSRKGARCLVTAQDRSREEVNILSPISARKHRAVVSEETVEDAKLITESLETLCGT